MLIDTGSIFVHLFTLEARKYRNLEGLWEKIPFRSTSEEGITNEIVKEFNLKIFFFFFVFINYFLILYNKEPPFITNEIASQLVVCFYFYISKPHIHSCLTH